MKEHWTDADLREWITAHPIGTPVRYWPARHGTEFRDSTIASEPWRLGHGQPVVRLAEQSGSVALDHLTKLPPLEVRDDDGLLDVKLAVDD